jgi:hypothetical protein
VRWARFTGTFYSYALGDWDGALRDIEALLTDPETPPGHYHNVGALTRRALINLARGQDSQPHADALDAMDRARRSGDPQQIIPALGAGAYVLRMTGDEAGAARAIDELLALPAERFLPVTGALGVVQMLAVASHDVGAEYVGRYSPHRTSRWLAAGRLAVAGDWAGAAEIYGPMGMLPDEALARLEAARDLVAAGRRAEADLQLRPAMEFFRSVGASRYLASAEALLAAIA